MLSPGCGTLPCVCILHQKCTVSPRQPLTSRVSFFQGCWQHRAFQRHRLHSERAVQHALGALPLASQTSTLDRSQRGGGGLLQPGLKAAQPATHRQLRRAQVRATAVGALGLHPLFLWTLLLDCVRRVDLLDLEIASFAAELLDLLCLGSQLLGATQSPGGAWFLIVTAAG